MKIFVNEMPKCCGECEYHRSYDIEHMWCHLNGKSIGLNVNYEREQHCPLQSIADHDAELLRNANAPKFHLKQTVYVEHWQKIIRCVIKAVKIIIVDGLGTNIKYTLLTDDDVWWNLNEKYLFATRKEAEQKLKEIEGKN